MRLIRLFAMGCFCLGGCIWAIPGRGESGAYDLGPGDELAIYVGHVPELSKTYAVSSTGEITFNVLLDPVQVAGLTAQQVDDLLTGLLAKDFLVNPEVSVEIKEYRSHRVHVIGSFRNPGTYELKEKTSLMEVIILAGGVTEIKPGQELVIFRNGTDKDAEGSDEVATIQEIRIDLQSLLEQGKQEANVEMQKGDIVSLSEIQESDQEQSKILVTGMVSRPGVIDFEEGMTAIGAILNAGGFVKGAAKSRTRVIRGEGEDRRVIGVDVPRVTDKGDKTANVVLEPGDMVFVPEARF